MGVENNIAEGWGKYSIGDFGKIITGKTPSKNNPEDWGDKIDFITPSDIPNNLKVISNCVRKLSEQGENRFNRMILPSGSVIVTCIGSDMGKVVMNKNKSLTNQQINSIIINDTYSNEFIYYLLKRSHKVLRRAGEGSGSTMPLLNKSHFESLSFEIPPLPEQKAIAKVLTAFDDKIELLQAQNKTLETMAQTIFKEWFGKYQIGDELPEGWRVGEFGEVIEFINGYAFKSKDLSKEPIDNAYKVFKMGDINKGGGFKPGKTKGYYPKSMSTKLNKYILKNGDLLMSMTDMKDAISLLGHTALMIYEDEYIVNQRVGLIRVKNDLNIEYPYLYLLTNNDDFIAGIRAGANSGVQVNLSTQGIKETEFIIADKETNKAFNNVVMPLFEKRKANSQMIKKLKKTRDTLLPKLMSGQVRVNNLNEKSNIVSGDLIEGAEGTIPNNIIDDGPEINLF